MVLVRIFGILDLCCAGLLLALTWLDVSFWRLSIGSAAYLILKGVLYFGDVGSFIDLAIGVYALLAILFPVSWLSLAAIIYLVGKGVWSLL